jgi:hypothetical protein
MKAQGFCNIMLCLSLSMSIVTYCLTLHIFAEDFDLQGLMGVFKNGTSYSGLKYMLSDKVL